jgi:hypothetical protein
LIWEHREADLERQCETLKKQQQMIENLAINFEEISGNMPDHTLPISGQLDQALNIIRSHIKLLAEAKIQSDLSRRRLEELESRARRLESDVNVRDKVKFIQFNFVNFIYFVRFRTILLMCLSVCLSVCL